MNIVDDKAAADRVIATDLMRLWVQETGTYQGEAVAAVAVQDKSGRQIWKGTVNGSAGRWGRSLKAENYQEVMSDSTLRMIESLLNNAAFRKALEKTSTPARRRRRRRPHRPPPRPPAARLPRRPPPAASTNETELEAPRPPPPPDAPPRPRPRPSGGARDSGPSLRPGRPARRARSHRPRGGRHLDRHRRPRDQSCGRPRAAEAEPVPAPADPADANK